MKKHLLLALLLSSSMYGQISFDQGYIIDNTNQKTNCLIKNLDWKNNPNEIEYKLFENTKPVKVAVQSIKEFGIDNVSKYISCNVNIDRSSEITNKLSHNKKPNFKKEVLFLKVLIEGNANLYVYENRNLTRYFYSTKDSGIEQLIYKSYVNEYNKISKNNSFRNQLWNSLKCSNSEINVVKNLNYQRSDLMNYFIKFNECSSGTYINYEDKQKRDLFNLSFRPGVNFSNLSIQNNISSPVDPGFNGELSFRFGIEAEFILPFNKNKWAFTIEPTYQYFKSKYETSAQKNNIDYKSIELPIGVRHYLFFNENSKLFINGSFVFDFSSESKIKFNPGPDLDIKTRNNLVFGFGYKYGSRYSVELRYQTAREILSDYLSWNSNYQTFSVVFGYSIF